MPPNLFIGHVAGDFLPAADWDTNFSLVESSIEGIGSAVLSGLVPSAGTGLSVNVTAGTALIGALVTAASLSIMGLTPSVTNYLFLNQDGTGAANTTGIAPANTAFLGTATTSGSAVTAVSAVTPGLLYASRGAFGHLLLGGGTAIAAVAGANAGTSPPAPVVTSGANDQRGNVTFGSGTGPAAGAQVVVTWAAVYASAPVVMVIPKNAATAALGLYVSAVTTTGFTLATQTGPTASEPNTFYSFDFLAIG